MWRRFSLFHFKKSANSAVYHTLYGAVCIERHVLRVYNIFKLPQISHIAVGEDISPQIPVDDILFVFHTIKAERSDVFGFNA